MHIELTEITPELASKLLENAAEQRLLSPRRVNALAQSIARDGWLLDGNPIRLDTEDRLIDGQHRLHAIIQADATVFAFIVRGIATEAQLAIDSGRSRSFSDFLRMQAVPQVHRTASATRLLYNIDSGNYSTSNWRENFASNSMLWLYFKDHRSEITEGLSLGDDARRQVRLTPSVVTTFAVLALRTDGQDAAEFFDQLSRKRSAEQPVLLLQRTVENQGRKAATGGVQQRIELAWMIKTWNRWRANDHSAQILRFSRGDNFPEMD